MTFLAVLLYCSFRPTRVMQLEYELVRVRKENRPQLRRHTQAIRGHRNGRLNALLIANNERLRLQLRQKDRELATQVRIATKAEQKRANAHTAAAQARLALKNVTNALALDRIFVREGSGAHSALQIAEQVLNEELIDRPSRVFGGAVQQTNEPRIVLAVVYNDNNGTVQARLQEALRNSEMVRGQLERDLRDFKRVFELDYNIAFDTIKKLESENKKLVSDNKELQTDLKEVTDARETERESRVNLMKKYDTVKQRLADSEHARESLQGRVKALEIEGKSLRGLRRLEQ